MFTRFKVLSIILIFIIFFTILISFAGKDGFIANKSQKLYLEKLEKLIKRKENSIQLLEDKKDRVLDSNKRDKTIIYSFEDEAIFDPLTTTNTIKETKEGGLSFSLCLIYSLILTFIYSIFILLILPRFKKRRSKGAKLIDGEKNGTRYY